MDGFRLRYAAPAPAAELSVRRQARCLEGAYERPRKAGISRGMGWRPWHPAVTGQPAAPAPHGGSLGGHREACGGGAVGTIVSGAHRVGVVAGPSAPRRLAQGNAEGQCSLRQLG